LNKPYPNRQFVKVSLSRHRTKNHTYWYLRWFNSDGCQHGQSIGRVDGLKKISRRQAEVKRACKEYEINKSSQLKLRNYKKDSSDITAIKKELEKEYKESMLNIAENDEGYIYLIKCEEFYKIGITKNPKQRIAKYKTENPFVFKIIFFLICKNYQIKEQIIKRIFYEHRHRGSEWFILHENEIEAIFYLINL
jgi:hypothetical protein